MTEPAAPAPGDRALRVLRAVAILTALGTVKAAVTMLGSRSEFLAAFPGLRAEWYAPMLALVTLNFAAAIGALLRLRWAVALFLAGGVFTIAADLLARGPAFHLWMTAVLLAFVAPAAWRAWPRLR